MNNLSIVFLNHSCIFFYTNAKKDRNVVISIFFRLFFSFYFASSFSGTPRCQYKPRLQLRNKHGVAKGKEPIPLFYGFLISCQDMLSSCQCRHQHHESGLRQVEVGDQPIQDLEFISRIDEDLCPATARFQSSVFI